jgi:hypothetical protein
MRWPGSWHRKATPRLAHIVEYNPDVEITLATALNKLRAAVEEKPHRNGVDHSSSTLAGQSTEQTAALIATVLRGENYHDPIAKLAMRYLKAGLPDRNTVETLRGIMLGVDPGRRDYKDGVVHKDRWLSRYKDIPRAVSTARSKIASPASSSYKAGDEAWPTPAALLKDEIETAPQFPLAFLPGPLAELAGDLTDRMQCAVDIVAIPLIITAATAIGKGFRMAPKAGDDWTERACLWGGVILPIGSMKSPGFARAL